MATLTDMLVYLRKRAGLSQQELADKLKLTRSAIGMYETGKREPDLEILEAFADFYNVDMNTLTGRHISISEKSGIEKADQPTDEEIKFALFGEAGDITDAMYDEVKNFAAYVKQREKDKKGRDKL